MLIAMLGPINDGLSAQIGILSHNKFPIKLKFMASN